MLAGALAVATAQAGDAALPSPLTLADALKLAEAAHPDLALAEARLEGAQAGLEQARSTTGTRVNLELTPQWVRPTTGPDSDSGVDDSRARLLASKRLYDFGRSRALEDAAGYEIEARTQSWLDARTRRRIEVMARFFDVLLADLRYAADNEAMAHTYVSFDKAREQHALGQISDVALLELEQRYQEALLRRTQSQARQAGSRAQLALALNRPDELPADLARPVLPAVQRGIPDYKAVLAEALAHSPATLALRNEVSAARAAVEAERARRRPVLSAELEAARYDREFLSRDELRATLNLRVPIYQGGEDSAAIAQGLARQHEAEARLARAELELRTTALDLVQQLETLKVAREAARVRLNYRDLYLDRSRALYELEVRTDLGDAMTQVSEAQWAAAEAEFRTALAWARLDALTGRTVAAGDPPPVTPESDEESKP